MYLIQGCSIGEAALLAKIDSVHDIEKLGKGGEEVFARYGVLSYVIYGDPTLRLYPLPYLIEHHPVTARRLLYLKRELQ